MTTSAADTSVCVYTRDFDGGLVCEFLETRLTVTLVGRVAFAASTYHVEAREAAKHPTMHRTVQNHKSPKCQVRKIL